jgi:hypothetical protein
MDQLDKLRCDLQKDPELPVSNQNLDKFIDILINNHLAHMWGKIKKIEWKLAFIESAVVFIAAASLAILGLAISLFVAR